MSITISKIAEIPAKESFVLLVGKDTDISQYELSTNEFHFIKEQIEQNKNTVSINQYKRWIFINVIEPEKEEYKTKENCRKAGFGLSKCLNKNKISKITLVDCIDNPDVALAFAEGMSLGLYQFLKYKTDAEEKKYSLQEIQLVSKHISNNAVAQLNVVTEAVFKTRTLINEPHSFLTAVQLSNEFHEMGKEAGFKVEVLNKTKIESLKMNGLLAVNKGSNNSPTFSILEYKPENPANSSPYVLVGKGLVFDSGGFNIKTGKSMDNMKADMSGAAVVAGTIYAIAKSGLPVHVVGLIPATDNLPGADAYKCGDVVKMFDGTMVEVLNTDAEGRLILADALSYAKKYEPKLIIDVATLTGSASAAVGRIGIVAMGTAHESKFAKLKECGNNVYERIVEFPLWDEYGEMIKSELADIKNIGGENAGAITAGKFLEHFVKGCEWLHLDIAGVAYFDKKDSYRGSGGTAIPLRLLFEYFKSIN
ncbi:MAG: leucyl aminopeptidase family protein [Bacteroidales bacterium]|nr:leucyl aminopeptidase family protein [Bacteroidales bacterium]